MSGEPRSEASLCWLGGFFWGVEPQAKGKWETTWTLNHLLTVVAQSRPFDLLVFPFWSSFGHGPKRLTFCFQVLWATEPIQTANKSEAECLVDASFSFSGFTPHPSSKDTFIPSLPRRTSGAPEPSVKNGHQQMRACSRIVLGGVVSICVCVCVRRGAHACVCACACARGL